MNESAMNFLRRTQAEWKCAIFPGYFAVLELNNQQATLMLSREILHNQKLFFYYRGDKESSNIIIGHADKLLTLALIQQPTKAARSEK
jgi:hypothetical protein